MKSVLVNGYTHNQNLNNKKNDNLQRDSPRHCNNQIYQEHSLLAYSPYEIRGESLE
jgi:hypothetical protein